MNTAETLSHEQAIELLPWLVNETLSAGEQERVLNHSRNCVICRRELGDLQALRAAVAGAGHVNAPEPDMRRVNARIDAAIARERFPRVLLSRAREWLGSPLRVAVAAQAVLLLALAGVIVWPGDEQPRFTTLTNPSTLAEGHYIRAVFDPGLPVSELGELLARNGLGIVDGPSSRGVYTLGYVDEATADGRAGILEAMRNDARVLFAEPLQGSAP